MIEITVRELLCVCSGRMLSGSEKGSFNGVSIDTRTIETDSAFFALKGERFDAHDFVEEAAAGGAAAVVVERHVSITGTGGCPVILVEDTLYALQQLASWWRDQFDIPVIGVTGSSGKTTTKNILACILETAGTVHKTEGNLNNQIGLPLTLLNLDSHHKACVLEMAMRGRGEIEELCSIASPTAGIITNVGNTHYELLGSVENIARAKGELAAALGPERFLLLNYSDKWSQFLSQFTSAQIVYFGEEDEADVKAREIELTADGSKFWLGVKKQGFHVELPLFGRHNIYNFLAATGAAYYLGFSLELIEQGVKNIVPSNMRLKKLKGIKGTVILDDTYNANPTSVRAALEVLKNCSSSEHTRTIAVLGDMFELGEIAEEEHCDIGAEVAKLGIHFLISVGMLSKNTAVCAGKMGMPAERIFCAETNQEAENRLKALIEPGDVILVKGSRGMRMEEIVRKLSITGEY